MSLSRRQFLASSAAAAASGFAGLAKATGAPCTPCADVGFGPLVADPEGLIDLPIGFRYRVISRRGDRMDDGFLVPDRPDGMATFAGPKGTTILITNHELNPCQGGPWGAGNELLSRAGDGYVYDRGFGKWPACGGTTTLVFDTRRQQVLRRFLSLAGTHRNCAGGPTPWNTWISCEETVQRRGWDAQRAFQSEMDHGYNFEVAATATPRLNKPVPLTAMGRFNHEAVAVDPVTSIVYQTEDRDDGLIYRFLPNKPRRLAAGGRLQVMSIVGRPQCDLRNWNTPTCRVGDRFAIRWLDVDDVQSPLDDLRYRGFAAGAARFARGEGMWQADEGVYFACTNGGAGRRGQLWRYVPSPREGTPREVDQPARLELFVEPNDSRLVESADNLTMSPFGDLVVCEDRQGELVRLVGVTPAGGLYTLAENHARTEFAGVTFSPDGTTLFVNLQERGETFAITGRWHRRRA